MTTNALPPLRDYQARAIAAARRAVGAGARGVLIQAPTGAGKTRMGLEIALGAVARGGTVEWFAHRDELVQQPLRKLREMGAPAGLVGEGAPITILSPQTALRRPLPAAATPSVVVFDEARHYASAPQWSAVAQARVAAGAVRIGLDATPSGDMRSLFDALVPSASIAELLDAGHLVPSVIRRPDAYQQELAADPVDAYLEHAPGSSAIVYCSSVAHAVAVAASFRARGVTAECIEGAMATGRRRAALARFEAGATLVLTNVMVACEGTDLPRASTIIIARGVGSEEMFVQIGGRGLRPFPGKSRCLVLDLRGHVHQFGTLSDERVWSLDGSAVRRVGAPVNGPASCPRCLGWTDARRGPDGRAVCRLCGSIMRDAPKPPRVVAAELREHREAAKAARAARAAASDPDAFREWCEFVAARAARGKAASAAFVWAKAHGGRLPRWSVKMAQALAANDRKESA